MRGRDKLIGCARKWELGRAGLEFQLPFYDIPSMAAERREFAFLYSPRRLPASSLQGHLALVRLRPRSTSA